MRKLEFGTLSCLGTASTGIFEHDDQSCLCCLADVSIETKYEGCLDERAWQVIVCILNMVKITRETNAVILGVALSERNIKNVNPCCKYHCQ